MGGALREDRWSLTLMVTFVPSTSLRRACWTPSPPTSRPLTVSFFAILSNSSRTTMPCSAALTS